jgi:hypothetical protein
MTCKGTRFDSFQLLEIVLCSWGRGFSVFKLNFARKSTGWSKCLIGLKSTGNWANCHTWDLELLWLFTIKLVFIRKGYVDTE